MSYCRRYILSNLLNRLGGAKIVANVAWLLTDRIMRMIIGLAVGIWLARYLGPTQIGQLSYATAILAIFSTIATFGLNGIVVRRLVVDNQVETTLGSAFLIQILSGIIAYILIIASIYILQSENPTEILIVSIIAVSLIFKPSDIFKYWFESKTQSKFIVISEGLVFLSSSLIKILLIHLNYPLIYFVWMILAEMIFSSLALFISYAITKSPKVRNWKVEKNRSIHILNEAWPAMISSLCVALTMSTDRIVLLEHVTLEELGFYAVATTLVSMWYFLPLSIGSSFAPKLAEKYYTDKNSYKKIINNIYLYTTVIMLGIACVIFFTSEYIVKTLYSPKFIDAVKPLEVMIWGLIFVSIVSLRNRFLTIENSTKNLSLLIMLGLLTNLLMLFFLVPLYGLIGAAYAYTVSWGMSAIIFPLIMKKTRHHTPIIFLLSRREHHVSI